MGTIRYTIAGGIWIIVVGLGALLLLTLPSHLGFPKVAWLMNAILILIFLTSCVFFLFLARRVSKYRVLRICLITAAAVFGFWMAFGILSTLLSIILGQYHFPDWLGTILYVSLEMLAPVVLLASIIGIIISVTKIILDGLKTKRRGQQENVGQG